MAAHSNNSLDDFILLGFSESHIIFSLLIAVTYTITIIGNFTVFCIIQVDSHLKTPMYFFLSCLSLLDVCYSTVTLPAMLANALTGNRRISFHRCFTQLYFFVCFGGSECLLLAVMAYDRYVAICNPLRYHSVMNKRFRSGFVAGCWVCGLVNAVFHTLMTLKLTFCGDHHINHFFCDVLPMLEAACSDIQGSQVLLHVVTIFLGMSPFLLVMNSYINIISTILKIRSSEGRQKVFSTCSSHLIVVTVFYITSMFNYNGPISGDSFIIVRVSSVLYSVVPPLLNPIVYSLRNKDVKRALNKENSSTDLNKLKYLLAESRKVTTISHLQMHGSAVQVLDRFGTKKFSKNHILNTSGSLCKCKMSTNANAGNWQITGERPDTALLVSVLVNQVKRRRLQQQAEETDDSEMLHAESPRQKR
ncbi:olfactory receptor 5V1-like [Leptodactylus fuscus]